jgi:hypothetical protein
MKIKIPKKVYLKLRYFVDHTSGEISGMAKTEISEDGEEVTIKDAMIYKQECTPARTELDDGAQAVFIYEMQKKKESLKDWNLWWHSHASMNVFWSKTDDDTIKSLKDSVGSGRSNFLISVVMNKAKNVLARIDVFPEDKSPFGVSCVETINDVKVDVINDDTDEEAEKELLLLLEKEKAIKNEIDALIKTLDNDPEIEAFCKKEIEEKVITEKKDSYLDYYKERNYSFGNLGWNNDEDGSCYHGKKDEPQKSFEKRLDEIVGIGDSKGCNARELGADDTVICLSCLKNVDLMNEEFDMYGSGEHKCPHCNADMTREYNSMWDYIGSNDTPADDFEKENQDYYSISCDVCDGTTSVKKGCAQPSKCPHCLSPFTKKKEQSILGV